VLTVVNSLWVLKKGGPEKNVVMVGSAPVERIASRGGCNYVVANVGSVPWRRKRTNRLMFCAAAARKNCSRTNFNLRRRRRRSPI